MANVNPVFWIVYESFESTINVPPDVVAQWLVIPSPYSGGLHFGSRPRDRLS